MMKILKKMRNKKHRERGREDEKMEKIHEHKE